MTRLIALVRVALDELATNAALAPLLLLTALAHPWALLRDLIGV